MPPHSALIIGASRGLGLSLTKRYAALIGPSNVFATLRASERPSEMPQGVNVMGNIDLCEEGCADAVVRGLQGRTVEVVVVVAGLLKQEKFGSASWKDELAMYTICSIAPVFIVQKLVTSSSLAPNAKIVLLTSEAGSITLRTQSEGGGAYGHHGSKAAANMVGHLLAYDLKERDVCIAMVHPGFLKTDMTKEAGLEEFYDKMGGESPSLLHPYLRSTCSAVTPDEAAAPFTDFVERLDMDMSGRLWAPMGARGIGNAEEVLGKDITDHKGPLELPW